MKNKYLILLFALCIFVVGCSSGANDNKSDEKYNELLTKINELEKNNDNEKQVEELNAKITALEESNKKLTEDLATTNKNLETVTKEKDSLKDNYNSLKSNYDSLNGKINSQKRDFYYVTFIAPTGKTLMYGSGPSGVIYSTTITLPTDKNGYVVKVNVSYPYPRVGSCGTFKYSKEDGSSVDPAGKFTADTVIYVTC